MQGSIGSGLSLRALVSRAMQVAIGAAVVLGSLSASAADHRVLPPGQVPQDHRLDPPKDLNGYFPFHPCAAKEAWEARAEQVRRRVLVALGLWPMPTPAPANAVVHGRVDREGYTVERVFLQSYPGHFVTGSLYRPKGRSGRLPGVLCPHGHWTDGRFCDTETKQIRQAIYDGAERFDPAGRSPLQSMCVQLVRMGCVVFHYDMVGYADSKQLQHQAGHRPAMSKPDAWGFFSPQAEVRQQNLMGLQTYNSIRALDWFCSLPDVDPQRIGVTGASGGGTQTFILCAVDPRPAVAFPAVMVGTAMQGGCVCENACHLRVGLGNVEIAALTAPRPMGLTAADDWTKELATKGFPELRQTYRLYGAEDRVMMKSLTHFPHNYNYVSRGAVASWMNKHLRLGVPEPVVAEDFKPLSIAEMTVWDASHPKPPAGDDYERSLLRWMTDDSQRQLEALAPHDAASLERYRKIVGGAADVLIGRALPKPGDVTAVAKRTESGERVRITKMLLRYAAEKEEVPAILLEPDRPVRETVLRLHREGKQSLFAADGRPTPAVRRLLDGGAAVLGVDLFGQGEFTPDGRPKDKPTRLTKNRWDVSAAYTWGYNPTLFAQRVHDVLTAVAFVKQERPNDRLTLLGPRGAGPWAAAARVAAGNAVDRTVLDTAGFRFAKIDSLDDPDLLPGGAKYLDLPGLLALAAPGELVLHGEPETPAVTAAAYRASGKPAALTLSPNPLEP